MLQLPKLARLNLLDRGFRIRLADTTDISQIAALIRAREKCQRGCLGAPHYPSLRKAVTDGRLHIAALGETLVGFVEYWRRRDGWQTIYSLAVDPHYEGLGIGRNLLYSVECPLRLKCPRTVNGTEPNPANIFYERAGLMLVEQDKQLNTWELPILPVLVKGNNREIPEVARRSGWAYGTRASETPRDWPYQVDLEFTEDWRAFDWLAYRQQIERWHPVTALALDYFEPEQCEALLAQIEDLRRAGILRILVCPKFHGAVADIPPDCVVAVSIPSTYAGFVPNFSELKGRKVHLLGGSPPKWFGSRSQKNNATGYISALQGAGAVVVSVDGNAHTAAAESGGIWSNGVWDFHQKPLLQIYEFMIESGRNIARDLWKSKFIEQHSFS